GINSQVGNDNVVAGIHWLVPDEGSFATLSGALKQRCGGSSWSQDCLGARLP
ncbi:hypothetical protein A2U01_0055004, partial [Trifolium medium]|nr:hypothetical protein [Trifolium medium]